MRFGARERPQPAPAEVVARADLPHGEKVLASAQSAGVWLLGTRAAFVVVAVSLALRIPWAQGERAPWDKAATLV